MLRGAIILALAIPAAFAYKCLPLGLCAEPTLRGVIFVGTVTDLGPFAEFEARMKAMLSVGELAQLEEDEASFEQVKTYYARLVPEDKRRRVLEAETEEVFEARLAEIFPFLRDEEHPIRFQVNEMLNGERESELKVWAGRGACGVQFQTGHRYLVFATQDQTTGRYETGMCSGSLELEDDNHPTLARLRALKTGLVDAQFVGVIDVQPALAGVTIRLESASVRGKGRRMRGVWSASLNSPWAATP